VVPRFCNLQSVFESPRTKLRSLRSFAGSTDVGNLPPIPGVFPDYPAPVVRNVGADRELRMMRWGMPPPRRAGGPPVTNIRNTPSAHWRGWLKPENRCLVPFNSFAEYAPEPNPDSGLQRVPSQVGANLRPQTPGRRLILIGSRRRNGGVALNAPSARPGGFAGRAGSATALRCRQSFTMRRMGMCRRGRRSRRNIAARRRIGLSICLSAASQAARRSWRVRSACTVFSLSRSGVHMGAIHSPQ
jgi:hypothetical protein